MARLAFHTTLFFEPIKILSFHFVFCKEGEYVGPALPK